MLGSGAVIVMDETRCMVNSLLRLSVLLRARVLRPMHPLSRRHGLAVALGQPHRAWPRPVPTDLALLDSVAESIMGRTICALGDAAAMPVRGMLKHFRDEFVYHVEHKTCMV